MKLFSISLVILSCAILTGSALGELRIEQTEDKISIFRKDQSEPLVVQNAARDHRPYLHPIMAPDGKGALTEYSPGHHKHQTGLYWGFTRVNGRDYFHHPKDNYWKRTLIEKGQARGDNAQWTVAYQLLDKNGDGVLQQTHRWTLSDHGSYFTLDLDWTGQALNGDVTIGKYSYGGLFLRMPFKGKGKAVDSDGRAGRNAEGKRSHWVDVGMPISGRKADDWGHIVIMDDPRNGVHPTPWRVDGQLGVGPARARLGDWKIKQGKPEKIRHRLLVYTGKMNAQLIARTALSKGATGAAGASSAATPKNSTVPFLTAEAAIEKMTYPEGFTVKAYAAEPQVVQPFAFCFDKRGRIWVAENLNYRTRGSDSFNEGPTGRIIILEDTDGDGVADKRKVFADKIFFPTGLAVGFGGVWVGSPPNLYFIADKNGDDKPDGEPKIVLDGWGRQDRHETLNSFLWGPDGWLYGCHGVFTHSNVGKPGASDDQRQRINAGVWRYHPVKDQFEVFAYGTSNPWGLDFDDRGQAFITACVIPHLWHMIQGGRYHRQGGRHFNPHVYNDIKTIADHRHKSAHGGARFYLADAFPEKYRKRLFMCNIHQHDVLTDIVEQKGSGFTARHGDEILASNDVQWLGFNMEIGPEGAMYIIDWHDADICGRVVKHGETGRIYRMSYKGTRGVASNSFDLSKLTDAELVKMQLHANDWYVRTARRILQERAAENKLGSGTHAALKKILDEHKQTPRQLRALWALHVTGGLDEALALKLLDHQEPYIRAWVIQLLCEDKAPSAEAQAKFTTMAAEDKSPVVRLYLASALQRIPLDQRWGLAANLIRHAEDTDDHNLPLMYWYGVEPLVAADKAKGLQLARFAEIPLLRQYIARRAVGDQPTQTTSNKNKPVTKPVTVEPAKSVSDDDLAFTLKIADAGADVGEGVSSWRGGGQVKVTAEQGSESARPKLAKVAGRTALKFDGKNDHLIIKHDDKLVFKAGDSFTLSAWIYPVDVHRGWQTIFAKSRDRSPWYGIWLQGNGKWVFGGPNNFSGSTARQGWHHVAVVQKGNGKRSIYVNGALVATANAQDGTGTGDIWIGGAPTVKEFFQGAIGDIRLYKRALSHPEVAYLAKQK